MTASSPKYVLDTNPFIAGFRDRAANETLQRFHAPFAPVEYLNMIVAQELRSGIHRARHRNALERRVLDVFERVNRTITPSRAAWHRSGDLLAEMARKEGLEVARVSKAFANDVLLALSCRESGCVLVTDNARLPAHPAIRSIRVHGGVAAVAETMWRTSAMSSDRPRRADRPRWCRETRRND